jgi:hypothetical protein
MSASDDGPGNKIRDGLYTDDERKTVIEHEDDGSTAFHRYFGNEWHEYHAQGNDEDAAADANQ